MDDFSKAVKDMFETGKLVEGEETLLTNVRHFQEITAAKESLEMALESAHQGMPEDFLTIDLMDAYHSLANVIGEDVGEDLIDRIFSSFCMGK
jgi:tRNA modification GTPase